jgi:pyruvate dehydrogenase E2 component (dihydrolipoamide acetyltransferase)
MAERVFAMPDLGEGLEEGEIVAWLVNQGDTVALNQPLVEVETAKATVEIPSPFAGVVTTLHGSEGDAVPVGSPLVTFAIEGAEADVRPAGHAGTDGSVVGAEAPRSSDLSAATTSPAATPAVRKLAKERGIDLATITGTGPGGRITVEDLTAADGWVLDVEGVEPITPVRREIARRLTEAAAVPQVTTFRTVDCTELDAFRRELDVSPLPVFVAALARASAGHPLLNASWHDDGIHVPRHMHVGIATDTDRGLMVPVLRNAHALGIAGIAAEIRRLAGAARDGHLRPNDLQGATIGVSNTGSYGSEAGTPLLNPGNAVTVALGVIQPRALVVEGDVVARPACTLSLTFDHRVLDGAAAGRALTDLVTVLQDGGRLRDLPV